MSATARSMMLPLTLIALLALSACGESATTPAGEGADTPPVLSPDAEDQSGDTSGPAPRDTGTSTPDDLGPGSDPDEDAESEGDAEASAGDAETPEGSDVGPADDTEETCEPDCEGKVCGDDGCGGSCGDCADGDDPCSDAVCNAGTCTSTFNNEASCDDENPCTEDDLCTDGACAGTPIDCEDDNTCTTNWCNQGVCMTEASEEEACHLVITIDSPTRGAILQNQDAIVVSGTVSSPASTVDHIVLNGEDVGVTNEGTFATTMVPTIGLNILEASASNNLDQDGQVAQSFIYGEVFHPIGDLQAPTMLPDSMGLWLSPDAFHDNDLSDTDDLSTLAHLVLNGLDLNALIPNPLFAQDQRPSFAGCDYDVSVTNLNITFDEVEFAPVDGGLSAYIEVEDLSAYIAAESDDGLIGDNCPDAKGPMSADQVTLEIKLTVNVVNGVPSVSIAEDDIEVTIYEFDWTIEEGLASLVDFLVPLVKGTIENQLIDALKTQVPESIIPLVNALLIDFTAFERIFAIPAFRAGGNSAVVNLKVGLHDASFTAAGAHLSLTVGSSAEKELDIELPGTLAGANCEDVPVAPLDKLPKTSVAEAYLDVDLSNQILYGLWSTGFIHMTVTEQTIGDAASEFGLNNPEITFEPLLPPIIHTCTSLGDAEVQIGDMRVIASFDTATGPLTMDLFASATVGADLTVTPIPDAPDALTVASVTPGEIVLDLQNVEGTLGFSDEVVEILLASVVSEVVAGDLLTGLIGAIPLPTLTIGEYVPGLEDDAVLQFDPTILEGSGAHLLLGGELTAE